MSESATFQSLYEIVLMAFLMPQTFLPTQFIILRLSFVAFEFQFYLNKPFNHLLVTQYRVNFVENYIIHQLLFSFGRFYRDSECKF